MRKQVAAALKFLTGRPPPARDDSYDYRLDDRLVGCAGLSTDTAGSRRSWSVMRAWATPGYYYTDARLTLAATAMIGDEHWQFLQEALVKQPGLDGFKEVFDVAQGDYAAAALDAEALWVWRHGDNSPIYVVDRRKEIGQVFITPTSPDYGVVIEMPDMQIWKFARSGQIRKYKVTITKGEPESAHG